MSIASMSRPLNFTSTLAGKEESSPKDKAKKVLSFFSSPAMSKCHCCDPIFEPFEKLGNLCKKKQGISLNAKVSK